MARQKSKTVQETTQELGTSTAQIPRQEEVRQAILDAQGQVETGYLDMAQLLSEAYHREYYTEWGFESFQDYASNELGMHYRKGMYLVDVWDKVKSLRLPIGKVEKLGWSKMKDLAQIITAENAKEWMKKAETMTSRELTEAVKVVRRPDRTHVGAEVPSITTMTFRMGEAEARVITEALEEAKGLTGSESIVTAMEMICQDWMAAQGVTPQRTSLEDHIAYLEKVYAVELKWKTADATKKEKAAARKKAAEVVETAEGNGKGKKKKAAPLPNPDDLGEGDEAPKGGQDINTLLGIQT